MNDGLRVPEPVPRPARHRRAVPGHRRLAVPVLDHVRRRARRPGAHHPAALPPRRARGPLRAVRAARHGRRQALAEHRPRAELLDELWPAHAPAEVIGEGIPVPERYDPAGFRARHGLGDRRFVLYGGRREVRRTGTRCSTGSSPRSARRTSTSRSSRSAWARSTCPRTSPTASSTSASSPTTTRTTRSPRPRPTCSRRPWSRSPARSWRRGWPAPRSSPTPPAPWSSWHCDRSGAGLTYDDSSELEQCLRFVAEAPDGRRRPRRPGPPVRARPLHLAGHARPHGGQPRGHAVRAPPWHRRRP